MVAAALTSSLPQAPAAPYPVEPLVARCRDGDPAAFREMVQKYHSWVQGTVYHLVPSPADLDDVIQNVWVEVFRCIHRFEGRSRFTTWLTRLAINVALGYRRKWRFWQRTEDTLSNDTSMTANAVEALRPLQPDEALSQQRVRTAVRRLVQHISPKKRVVFVLSEIQGLQAPEIAAMLQIPAATVRTRLFHARREFETLARQDPVLGPSLSQQQ